MRSFLLAFSEIQTRPEELASKEAANVALKELYIYWRAEMAPCFSPKKYDVASSKFWLLLERVHVEASWRAT
jgi:hypothetical protein